MATIDKLSSIDALAGGDLLAVQDASNSDTRKATISTLSSYLQSNLTFSTARSFTRLNAAPSASGTTVTVTDGGDDIWLVIAPAADYAAMTITLPAVGNAENLQEVLVACTKKVQALTVSGNGATVNGAPSSLSANDSFRLKFDSSTSSWHNVQTGPLRANGSYTHSATGPTDDVDVSGVNVLYLDTSSNSVTIGGFTGGIDGQVLRVVRLDTTNNAILEHNEGGGSQDIFLADEGDQTLTTYGGWTLVCNGTSWFEVGY